MKSKKALCLASMASNLDNFNRDNVKILQELGYDVTLASNFHTNEDINSQEKIDSFMSEMSADGVHIVQVDFSRRIKNLRGQIASYKQVRSLLANGYDLIHCHSPICAAITRMCAKKYRKNNDAKVVYTAHGFHFYDGAPLKNWLIFYPIEKHFSRYTDVLITINNEDYKRASTKLKAKKTVHVPGVGVDTKKYADCKVDKKGLKNSLGLADDDYVIISVGELNENKNHEAIIRTLINVDSERVKYVIVGKGLLEEHLRDVIQENDLSNRVVLTGYRTDIDELLNISDCFAFPSKREGLGLAAIEGMAAGLPVIGHDIGGIRDFVIDGETGWLCKSNTSTEYRKLLKKTIRYKWDEEKIKSKAREFDKSKSNAIMRKVYESL